MTHACGGCTEYRELSRRRFLADTAGAGVATAILASTPVWLPRVSMARDFSSAPRDVVVCVFLRGGADALTMVPPYSDANYAAARPNLAIPAPGSGGNSAIPIPNAAAGNTMFGLAPAMAGLLPAYMSGKLLLIHAVGSTSTTRSHFDGQRFMEAGLPDEPGMTTGWLGRHLISSQPFTPNQALRGVGIASGMPRSLLGAPASIPVQNLDDFNLLGATGSIAQRQQALADMYGLVADPLRAAALTSLSTMALLEQINFAGYQPAGGASYATDPLGVALKSSAALIKAQVGVEAIAIDVEGWDTHDSQGVVTGTMASLMSSLGAGVSAFYSDMFTGVAPSVTLVVMSEFGRRVAQNGSGGTDHGHAGLMMVLGSCVNGGRILTDWPGLAPGQLFQGLDVAVTIDYRDILAEIVSNRLGNPNLSYVFPAFTPTNRGVFSC